VECSRFSNIVADIAVIIFTVNICGDFGSFYIDLAVGSD
jgi:hypothetical protein